MANTQTNNDFQIYDEALLGQSILDVFLLQDLLEADEVEKIKSKLKSNREVEQFLIKNKIVTQDTVNKAYSIILKLPYVELKDFKISDELKSVIGEKVARRYGVIPFSFKDGVIKLATSRPSDILVGFERGLEGFFQQKNIEVELFITGQTDFQSALRQYGKKKGDDSVKGNLPVVFLRNQSVKEEFLRKLPIDFIEKYRMVVFGQNRKGHYFLACENPDSSPTEKIIEFLEKENGVLIEKFATSKDDVDYVIDKLGSGERDENESSGVKNDKKQPAPPAGWMKNERSKEQSKEEDTEELSVLGEGNAKKSGGIKSLIGSLLESSEPELTINSMTDPSEAVKKEGQPAESTESQEVASKDEPAKPETGQSAKEGIDASSNSVSEAHDKSGDKAKKLGSADTDSKLDSNDIGALITENITEESQLEEIAKEAFVPKIVAAVINFALNKHSSDIHVEPEEKILRIRCRVDGILRDVMKLPPKFQPPFVSRVKILSKLKIDEQRIPQDGRFDLKFQNREVDVRVSTLPTVHGEKLVMRILDKSQGILSLEDLGMEGSAFSETIASIAKPYGVILSTGPTGSGKSTTLYAILNRISIPGVNVVTLEDPVEYEIAGVNQCQIKPDIGFTFAAGLRSILRQDPNIIMVGEIRDAETASMATHAALTGHLVLSTLHTNDTAGALPRLINMGIEPFLITSSVNLIIAQRLVRRICPKCKEELKVPDKLMEQLKVELDKIPSSNTIDMARKPKEFKLYYGKGCKECDHGFKGRVGIFEVMTITPEIEELAIAKSSANDIKDAAIKNGMITMRQDGILKAFEGFTTIDEVFQAAITL